MALKIRKDIKKSSYYVWFLGAKESKGIRGEEYILPVIEHLVQREKEIEPFKVTLQVSHKGLKIIQNVLSTNPKTSKPKNETIKHFIPHNTITCVYQDDDIVSCILLLYNPVTKCPLHVHVYRCDSNETATLLKNQLEILIDRPENQKKISDLENRFSKPTDVKKKFDSSIGSDTGMTLLTTLPTVMLTIPDCRIQLPCIKTSCNDASGTSTRESESTNSSEDRYPASPSSPTGDRPERMSSLYDSLAAELRQKLRKNSPILLPPRDYDTVHRQRGNLSGIDTRRCLTASVVGPQGPTGGQGGQGQTGRRLESSGGSSGIGSDHAPSPENEGNYLMDNQSTSDEEWNADQTDSTLYLMHGSDMILPRASRHPEQSKFSPEPPKSPTYHPDPRFQRYPEDHGKYNDKPGKDIQKYPERHVERQVERHGERIPDRIVEKYGEKYREKFPEKYPEKYVDKRYERYDSNGREKDGYADKEKYLQRYPDERGKYLEDIAHKYPSKYEETTKYPPKYEDSTTRYSENGSKHRSTRYPDDFEEEIDYRTQRPPKEDTRRSKYDEQYYQEDTRSSRTKYDRYYPEPEKIHPKYRQELEEYYHAKQKYPVGEDRHYYKDSKTLEKGKKYSQEDNRYRSGKYPSEDPSRSSKYQEDYFEDHIEPRRRPEDRQRSPTPPETNVSPKDRFKDAKEKFLLLERERISKEELLRRQELHNSVPNLKDKTFLKRHESMVHKDRWEYHPKPAPRTILEEETYRREPLDRYRNPENRRSMYNQIEVDHKTKSNEIAKELKRRSYLDSSSYDKDYYQDKRYLDKDSFQFSKSNVELDKIQNDSKFSKSKKQPAGYRHSYAEPKLSIEKTGKKIYPDMVHRTNSSVSNSGRVGLASVNPY